VKLVMTTEQNIGMHEARTGSEDPEAMRQNIDRTRAALSRDIDTLADKVTPSKVVRRQANRVKGTVSSVSDRVMGGGSSSSGISDLTESAVTTTRSKAQGNPLAAGLIAFGVGWLASSLLPATAAERQVASGMKDTAMEHSDQITAPLKSAAGETAEELSGSAREAVESVKSAAAEGTTTVQQTVTDK